VFLLLTVLVPAASAQRATPTLDDFVGASSSVVVGRPISQQSAWDEEGRSIVTRIRVAVDETVAGEAASEIELVIPGGRVGNIVQEVSHMPLFTDGEEVLLFVWTAPNGRKMTVGGEQGKLEVVEDAEGRKLVRGLEHLMHGAAADGHRPEDVGPGIQGQARGAVPLDELRERIRGSRK